MSVLNKISIKSLYMLATVAESKNLQQASNNLCISPSALSHQMQRLEDAIGKPLFYKKGRNQKLTPDAMKWAKSLSENFVNIEQTTNQFVNASSEVINLGVSSAFAFNRVNPALSLWLQNQPDMDVRIKMLNCGDDPLTLGLDVVLSTPFDSQQYCHESLATEKYIPVCSNFLYQQLQLDNKQHFFTQVPLLELVNVESWQVWCKFFSKPTPPKPTAYFSHTILLLQAVLSGQGVALLDYYLIKDQLNDGSLIQLNDEALEIDGLVHTCAIVANKKNDAAILKLTTWLNAFFE